MSEPEPIVRAAGGLLLRPGAGGLEVVLVHRPKYDDWTFPKGKLNVGETDEEAAIREVEEETGYRARLDEELASVSYRDPAGRPKVVRYWTMTPLEGSFVPNREVDELRWLPLEDALRMLSYEHDRELLTGLG